MRYARSKYADFETRLPFWRFLRRFAKPDAIDSQAFFDPPTTAPEHHPCTPGNRIDVMSNHTMSAFDADLSRIRSEVIDMGDRVEKAVKGAVAALTKRDLNVAETLIQLDTEIDSMQRETETNVVETIARRQPFAVDLRELVGAFHIVNNLERIGDLAKSICKRALVMEGMPPARLLRGIQRVSAPVLLQLALVLDSYAKQDAAEALAVWSSDWEIDAAHGSLLRELLTHMIEDPRNIVFCAHLLFCSKNLERMGDHTTNIAESVHYMVTGQRLNGDRPKKEDLSFLRLRSVAGARSALRA